MMVYNRYRERTYYDTKGEAYALAPGLSDYSAGSYGLWGRGIYDVVGHKDEDNVLLIGDVGWLVGRGSGQVSSFFACKDWPTGDYFYNWDFLEPLGTPSDGEVITQTVARTSPDRPTINVPVFLYELKDLPGMVKSTGNAIKRIATGAKLTAKERLKYGSEEFLTHVFGWQPLISDLWKMYDFMFGVDQKIKALNRLYSEGGLHAKHTAFDGSVSLPERGYYIGPAYGAQASVMVQYECKLKKWGTVRYRPTSVPAYRSFDEQLKYARQLTSGLSLRPATLWEAVPWSWMIDWFSNVGDYIAAHTNSVPLSIERLNVMTRLEIVPVSYRWIDNPYGASFKLERKRPMRMLRTRTPTTLPLLPSFHLPFLSGKQLSILSALAVQKFGK